MIRFLCSRSIVYVCIQTNGDNVLLAPLNSNDSIIKLPKEEIGKFKLDEYNHYISPYLSSEYNIVSFALSLK